MRAKGVICIAIGTALCLMLAACGSASGGVVRTNLSGTPEEILDQIVQDITDAGIEMPMALPPTEVPPDESQHYMGLSEEDFGRLVDSAWFSMAALSTFAHQIIIVEANDAAAANEVKRLVSGDDGYDAKKWICVFPERALAVESGRYVLIAASKENVTDAALEFFTLAAGTTGEAVTFWEFEDGGEGGTELGAGGMELVPFNEGLE